ncbi:hypothetical protein VTK56DRAFT_4467 [Thermocarpiscus australiensis]
MVKIAVAGPGQVAREIIDGLLATGNHDIIILARKDATPEQAIEGATWVRVDFQDRKSLVQALHGVHTVLSFLTVHGETATAAQKGLIDAAIEAGVKRIAPSEWTVAGVKNMPWYNGKTEIREYLEETNRDKKVIEYTLFQTGWFMNLLLSDQRTSKYLELLDWHIDFVNCRALVPGHLDHMLTFTTIQDVVAIVVKAVEYEGEWPEVGGINGATISIGELIRLGEKFRGKPFNIEILDPEDLKCGVVKSSWLPEFKGPAARGLDEAAKREFSKQLVIGMLLTLAEGDTVVSDDWNRIFPDFKFTSVQEFLANIPSGV